MVEYVTFGQAIEAIKQGKKAKRAGWNGKDQYIEMVSNISYKRPNGDIVNADHETMGSSAVLFHGTIGEQVGWLASQADILSEDWIIF